MANWNDPEYVRKINRLSRTRLLDLIDGGKTITEQQKASLRERKIKGPIWVSRFRTDGRPPETDARDLLCRVVEHYRTEGVYQDPSIGIGPLEGEWTGFRSGVDDSEPEPDISEGAKYRSMQRDSKSPVVVFYVYGGHFYMNGPSSYRKMCLRLAKTTGGRSFCIRQRLSPEYPFPAAILDVFHGYLSLLAPPPGSYHEPIPASSIVFAGDSSGANMALGLIQVLLTIKRERWASNISFFGQDVPVDTILPAGLTAISPACSMSNGLPSWERNAAHDIQPDLNPVCEPTHPICSLWPSNPPRAHIYCDASMFCHPLVNPVLCKDWSGSPPLWFSSGQEQIIDAIRYLAQTASKQGVSIQYSEYELMPHCFAMSYGDAPQTQRVWKEWAEAIVQIQRGQTSSSTAVFVHLDGSEDQLDPATLVSMTFEEIYASVLLATKKMRVFTGRKQVSSML